MNGTPDQSYLDSLDDFGEPAEALPNGIDTKPPVTLRGFNPRDWQGTEPEPRKWIVPGYIPDETVTLLSADGGTGKSWIKLQLAVARALARDWLGLLPEPGKTLVLSCEDDLNEMHRRLDSILKFYAKQIPATWEDLSQIRLIDLVGQVSILGLLNHGQIVATAMYKALDAYIGDFKPGLVSLDVLADLFAGEERSRSQTRQFVNLLKALTLRHRCAILLLAHPSIAGMSSGTGMSGSTDWNNAFRSRLYFERIKTLDGDEPNKNLRSFQGKKSNYSEIGGKIELEWKNGLFVPVQGPLGLDKLAAEQKGDEVYLANLKRRNSQSRTVSDKPGANYAPAVFAKEPEAVAARLNSKQLEAAMERLFKTGKIRVEINGPPSRQTRSIVIVDG
jgi:RecA-family ATPase